jgi:hypothetical protein
VKDFPTYKLNALSRKVLRSLVPVICPREAVPYADEIVDGVESVIDSSPRLLHHGFGAGLLAFDLQALPSYGQRAHKLVGEPAERYYTSWEHGITPVHVQLARALNQLISMSCYEQPEMKKRVGYHVGPWIEQVTKKRLQVYSKEAEAHAASLLAPDPLRPGVDVRALRQGNKKSKESA